MRGMTKVGLSALILGVLLPAATLEKLTLDDMTQKATAIVRARVVDSYGARHGAMIYTHYRLQVTERWKGSGATSLEVVVPGGAAAGLRQTFAGAPKLLPANEYVMFLWTGRSGLTHVIGLTQGLFNVSTEAGGEVMAIRPASTETMLDPASGQAVRDENMKLTLSDLRQRVGAKLATGGRR
jgi:hypothetical protein